MMLNSSIEVERCVVDANYPDSGIVKTEFPMKPVIGKLLCFFCEDEFTSVDILHLHQMKCSSVCDIQTVLSNAKNSRSEKRGFLSQLNLISKGKAEHLRTAKRQDVVVDVIVIDDNSDDEDRGIAVNKSLRYLQTPSNCNSKVSSKKIPPKKSSSQVLTGKVSKQSRKVYKFDISSPLGMRLRYHGSCGDDSKLTNCKTVNTCYELYCGLEALKCAEVHKSHRYYPVTFRKQRQLKYSHKYKFRRRELRQFCQAKYSYLNMRSRKLKRQMKPCFIGLEKLDLCEENVNGKYDVREFVHLMPPRVHECESKIVGEVISSLEKVEHLLESDVAISALVESPAESTSISVGYEMSTLNAASGFSRFNYINDSPIYSVASPLTCPSVGDAKSSSNQSSLLPIMHRRRFKIQSSNVEFVPLSALRLQTFGDKKFNREDDLFQISSVFSLAGSALNDDVAIEHMNGPTSVLNRVENTENNLSSKLTNEIVTVTASDSTVITTKSYGAQQNCQIPENIQGVMIPPINSNIIDLTSTPLELADKVTSALVSQAPIAENRCSTSAGLMGLPKSTSDKLDLLLSVSESSSNQSAMQRSNVLPDIVAKPVVIEIPDEDSVVLSHSTMHCCTDLQTSQGLNMPDFERMLTASKVHNQSTNSHFSELLRQSLGQLLAGNQILKPSCSTVQSDKGVRNSELIDLSVDSDCEAVGNEPTAVLSKSSNTESGGRAQKATGRMLLEDSLLPPLTFRCHICGCLFEFDNNSGALIQSHYLTHNVTNIQLIKHISANRQTTWSLVELDSVTGFSDPSPHQATSDRNNISFFPPSLTLHHTSNDRDVHNHNRSPIAMKALEQSQRSNVSHPQTNFQLDRNRFGFNKRVGNFENCKRKAGREVAMPFDSNSSVTATSGDTAVFQDRGNCRNKQSFDERVHRGVTGLRHSRPHLQHNSFTAFHIFPRPDFQEQTLSNGDRDKTVLMQTARSQISSQFEKVVNLKAQTNSIDSENCTRQKNLVQVRQRDYDSFNTNGNCMNGVICLD